MVGINISYNKAIPCFIKIKRQKPNIRIFEYHVAVDLVVSHRLNLGGPNRCFGAYVLDVKKGTIVTMLSATTTIACGGAGKGTA